MDAIEVARQTAARLHAEAVAMGQDPLRPYAFAVAEARRRGFEVERTAAGGSILDGGRAVFRPADGLILHEDAGSDFERAFLVAHEIGHAECGDGEGSLAGQAPAVIDPARAAEPSPTGLDRVVDYGRRQRREIQMDLFAREFLLPRALVRQLHIEQNLGLAAISVRFGAPQEVVAQQLLDALLLPPITSPERETEKSRELNPKQRDAVTHRGLAYLLEAGPGTGKTQTLVARVESLLNDGIDPRRILLLTFSNRAAGEMAERIARRHKAEAAAMWIGTFHAFGLDLVRRFHTELGLPADPRLLDKTEAVELIENEFPRLGLKHYLNLYDPTQEIADILAAISRAKDEIVDAAEYAALAERMKQRATTEEAQLAADKAAEIARVYAAYEELKRSANSIDFGDLVSLPVRLLETSGAVRSLCQDRYDHVLVDEYQDVNRSSVRLLAALKPDGQNLWVVGDPRQSIYRFRGASAHNVSRFGREDFPGGVRDCLQVNYRSVPEITAAFSHFATGMTVSDSGRVLTADRGSNGLSPEFRTVDFAIEQPVAIADRITEMRAAGHRCRDQAVLCTGNESLANLAQDLESLGIPVLFLGSLFERPEAKDLFSFLSLLVDRRATGVVRIGCWPDFLLSMADVAAMVGHLRAHDISTGAWRSDPAIMGMLSPAGQETVCRLAATLHGFGPDSAPWHVLITLLLDRTRIVARLAVSNDLADRARGIALWQVMNFIRAQPPAAGQPVVRLLDRVRRLLRLSDDRDLRQLPAAARGLDAVRLMTIHGAKGLEFPVVHLAGMTSRVLPRPAILPACLPPDGLISGGTGNGLEDFKTAHGQEQECLFYVAASRPQDRFFLYAPTKTVTGARQSTSPFVDRLGAGLVRDHVTPVRRLPELPELMPIPLEVEGGLKFSAQQIALYESCPRRFFYTYVLQTGGRRTTTPFMQMHDAVSTIFSSLVAEGTVVGGPALEERVTAAFASQGLTGHGYESHYREFALGMLRFFAISREKHTPEAPTALSLTFGEEEIVVRPDDVLVRGDGGRTIRSIRTGHQRSADTKDVRAAAFILAARRAFPGAVAELVYLSDGATVEVLLSAKELKNREEKLTSFLQDIRKGNFPANPSTRVCPKCPAFFVCGPVPAGVLQKKF